jgi:hypothetical protein
MPSDEREEVLRATVGAIERREPLYRISDLPS